MQQPFQAQMQQQHYHQSNGFGHGQQVQFQGGHGSQGGQGCGCGNSRGGCQHRHSFAAQIRAQNGQGQMVQYQGHNRGIFSPPNPYGGIGPFAPTPQAQPANNTPSPVKQYANWNACFLCGFYIKVAHNLATCPFVWYKPNHQVGYTRENAALYAAYGLSTTGQLKKQFPPMWQEGAEDVNANKRQSLVSAAPLNPTQYPFACSTIDDDNITIATSNVSSHPAIIERANFAPHICPIEINDVHGITDTGATSVFVKEGVPVTNKQLATHPLTVNLSDLLQGAINVHVWRCGNSSAPSLCWTYCPQLGHRIALWHLPIVCNAGCIVVFDKYKCNVWYEGKIIIMEPWN
jgi:hypothetical protein